MMKINYIHEVLLSERNTCLRNLIILHPKNNAAFPQISPVHIESACEIKNNCCLFERLFKVKENGVFLFEISFFILEKFTFLYYANEESDDVINHFI